MLQMCDWQRNTIFLQISINPGITRDNHSKERYAAIKHQNDEFNYPLVIVSSKK